jgi:hypothetical protein
MGSGAEEMMAVLEEIKGEVMANPCNMGDVAMRAMASALRTLYRSKVPKRYSREMAARELNVSVRQLSRIVAKSGIKPHRDGFKNIYYTEEDIVRLKSFS